MNDLYKIKVKTIDFEEKDLSEYEDNVMIIVNTASYCGFSYQYNALEKIYKTYQNRGLVVLGFPCNQFNTQEPGNEEEIKQFCRLKYDVSFPLFAKIEVKGQNIHPLFQYLTSHKKGIFGTQDIKWNFTKFLIDRKGNVLKRYAPSSNPEIMIKDIEKLL